MNKNNISRRQFIHSSGVVMVGTSAMLAGCGGGSSPEPTPAPTPSPTPTPTPAPTPTPTPVDDGVVTITPQDKSLVFIMLDGGNDSFNMLVPTTIGAYNDYKNSRGDLAIAKEKLLALNNFKDKNNKTFGLHPSLPKVANLFNQNKLSFVANIAPLVEPLTKAEFKAGSKPVPLGLMSHSDQFKHWQTSRPTERSNSGWFGTFADVLQPSKADNAISMNISLAGSNIMQNGKDAREYAVTAKGSVGLSVKRTDKPELVALNNVLIKGFDSMLAADYSSAFDTTYIDGIRHAQAQHETFKAAIDRVNINTSFKSKDGKESELASQLKMVAKSIAAAPQLGMRQQTFFVRYIGWDHHSELLNNHQRMLSVLDDALAAFQSSLKELGVEDRVVTFTGSDFGRSLTSNGNGTDHGWGGNTLVMGQDVTGGKIFGDYPELTLGDANPLDVGGGVLIPTTATDELYAELALWFGVDKVDLPKLFPNLDKFYDNSKTELPLGAIADT
ncbi:MAG: DUF1501 domain-containing protein [Psychrobium sp.]